MTLRPVIAIDCDDVLINASQHLVDEYNRRHGTAVQLANAHMSKNGEWEADRDEVFRRLQAIQDADAFGEIQPRDDALEVIPRLAARFDLHLVTARQEAILSVTERMLEKHFPGCFVGVNHTGPDKSKGEVCARINAVAMVDDNIRHLESAYRYGATSLIWFGDYLWHDEQQEQASVLPVVKCSDWHTVETVLATI